MSKKHENNCNFAKCDKFPCSVSLSPKVSKFLHQIQLLNSFHLIHGPFCDVKHFDSNLRKTESNWLQPPPPPQFTYSSMDKSGRGKISYTLRPTLTQ